MFLTDSVEIFFGELDYQEVESNDVFKVVVTKMGFLRNNLFLTITPLTFDEFRQAGHRLPDEEVFDQLNTVNPAECKPFFIMGSTINDLQISWG